VAVLVLTKEKPYMQRRTPTLFRLLALFFVLALVAGACGGRDDDDGDAGGQEGEDGELATGPGFDGKTIKLGVITPLSGPVSGIIGLPLPRAATCTGRRSTRPEASPASTRSSSSRRTTPTTRHRRR
jgi:hypothetical protein